MACASDTLRFTLLQHFELATAWQEFFAHHSVRQRTLPATVRYGFFSVLIRGAITGMGLALVPDILVADELRTGSLINPGGLGCTSHRVYYLTSPRNRSREPAIARFRDWALAVAATAAPAAGSNARLSSKRGPR